MRSSQFPPSVIAAAMSACATESVILNTERIEKRFGSYGIEVLASEARLRRSSLFSFDGDTATCRTYALVEFAEHLDDRYDDAHAKILAGDSIGETFRENGWDIQKSTLYIGTLRLPEKSTEIGMLMRLTGAHDLAVHVYRLLLARRDVALQYATIMEVHHPEYLTAPELRGLFESRANDRLPADELTRLAERVFASAERR